MDNSNVFKYLLTNKVFPENEIKDYEFKFTTVFRKFGPTYCCCRCAFDHEYFSYISDKGNIDMGKLDNLVKALKDGYCQHTTKENIKCYFKETKVNILHKTQVSIFHIAAALGSENLSETLLKRLKQGTLKPQNIKSGLFQLHPYEIAILKGSKKLQHYVESWKYAEDSTKWWRYLDDTFIYVTEKEKDVLHVEEIPLYELYIKKRNNLPNMLFDTSGPPINLACRTRI